MKNQIKILTQLKKEINETLYFFVSTDLSIYGYVTEETINCFKTQKVTFPNSLKDLKQI